MASATSGGIVGNGPGGAAMGSFMGPHLDGLRAVVFEPEQ